MLVIVTLTSSFIKYELAVTGEYDPPERGSFSLPGIPAQFAVTDVRLIATVISGKRIEHAPPPNITELLNREQIDEVEDLAISAAQGIAS